MAEQENEQHPLIINMQYTKDLSFENPNAPAVYGEIAKGAPDLTIDIDVQPSRLQDRTFEVVLNLQARAMTGDKTAFLVELDYAGIISIGEHITAAEDIQFLVMVDAPRHLFPFARQILAEATRNGGFPPLVINPVDFVSLYKQRMAAFAEAAEQSEDAGETENGETDSGETKSAEA
ncbi:protein-export chaperone SecB [Pelagibius sp. Alg239-R121]|uniref:protein-export chaperone SecB n=1 Tax=Pelagibius sp. Alg239-R121 TaxID=2993448 RepID=UPI0024A66F0B|nr:protein-export chaperone SecB [Pelagibius sp. Alg239-R121]